MCTLTWSLEPGGFDLFFSRDEVRTRRPALPPTVAEHDGLSIAAPTDADAGGTWIAVNSAGLAVCLLNGYRAGDVGAHAPISRGLLVRELASAPTWTEVAHRLERVELRQYRSFALVAFEPGPAPHRATPHRATWNGTHLEVQALTDADRPLCSSSLDPIGSGASRRAQLLDLEREHGPLAAAQLEAFHRTHLPERGSLSVCMHREDAHTVSLTHVRVSPDSALLRYSAGAPCAASSFESVRLRRTALATSGGAGRA